MALIEEKSMAEAAARPDAGEKEALLEVLLKEEEGNDFPRAIPKEAKAKEREKDMVRNLFRQRDTSSRRKIFVSKVFDKLRNEN